jgi:hypothetical protein
VNFTREPIIETIISPKEGFKLLVRNSKGENFEEYYVDSVEVVSFGRAFFFRSTERPKAFLVPVSDYEVVEVKEARVALKNASYEKNIKIGGGREAPMRPQREHKETVEESTEEEPSTEESTPLDAAVQSRMDRKRDRRRHRKRRGYDERETEAHKQQSHHETEQKGEAAEAEPKAAPVFSSMIPPPPTLISETLSRYREKEAAEPKEHDAERKEKPPEEEPGADSSSLQRVMAQEGVIQETHFNANYFIPFSESSDNFF